MEAKKIMTKHEESKETREMPKTINSSNTTAIMENRVKPAITLN